MPRFTVQKVHATALQKRLYPESRDKPYVVRDGATAQLLGLPDRYKNRSGAQARADRENAKEEKP
jgi:hypothetical protein